MPVAHIARDFERVIIPLRSLRSFLSMTIKDDLHHLVDELDENAAREALAYLHTLGLPAVLRNAPIDDEPETDEERAAVQEARDELERGEFVSAEEAKRRLLE